MNRPYLSADLRRAEAVATVIELAATHDPAVMTTGQIASAMGVSQGALFRHFPDKMAIWTAVLEWTCGELTDIARAENAECKPLPFGGKEFGDVGDAHRKTAAGDPHAERGNN